MSYAFRVVASSKAAAKAGAATEFDAVAQAAPLHAADREHALTAIGAFIDLLGDDDTRDVQVLVNGALLSSGEPEVIHGAAFTVSAELVARQAES